MFANRNHTYPLKLKKAAILFVLVFLSFNADAQVFKKAPNGARYYEKDGRFIFPGSRTILYDTIPAGNAAKNYQQRFGLPLTQSAVGSTSYEVNNPNATIVLNITTTRPTCGYGSGSIIVEAANGVLPYTYFLTDAFNITQQQNTGNFPVVGAGTYTVKVKDANGDSAVTTVTLTDISPGPVSLGFSGLPVRPSGCTTNDGSIVLNATGGTPPYTYSLDLVNFQTSNVFSNLYPNLYDFYVKDANGCIDQLSALGLLLSQNGSCYDDGLIGGASGYACLNDAPVDIQMIGTNGPYQYSMDGVNYQPTGQFSNVGIGVHRIYIKKANGQVVIVAFNKARFCEVYIEFVTVAASCLANNGTLEVNASRGTPPYSYTIDGINYQSSNIFTNLAPGNYFITVRDKNGIKSSVPATVFDRCPIVQTVTTKETCVLNDGTITAGGFRGTEPYEFSLNGGAFQNSVTFTGLQAGTYNVTIKDALGFTGSNTAVVGYNCLQLSLTSINAKCGNNNGSIQATASTGTPPYEFSINGGAFAATNVFSNLAPGLHTIRAKDAVGSNDTKTVTILALPVPVLVLDTVGTSCAGNDGRVILSVAGGEAPYTYSFNGTVYNTVTVLNNVRADSVITAFVKDKNGCVSSQTFKLSLHCPLTTLTVRPEVCTNKDGTVIITVAPDYAPYAFSINGGAYQNSNVFTGLGAGSYVVRVKDKTGVVNTYDVTVNNSCVTGNIAIVDETCDASNATITVTASSGTAPYTFSINGGAFQSSGAFSGLKAGNYVVRIKDAFQTITLPPALVKNIPAPNLQFTVTGTDCSDTTGVIQLTASGGTAPYLYSLDSISFVASNLFSKRASGNYKVHVKDKNGCVATRTFALPVVSNLTLSVPKNLSICEGDSIKIEAVSNGSSFIWTPVTGVNNSTVLKPVVKPVITTNYFITATKGICNALDSVIIAVKQAPIANAKGDTTLCFGQSTELKGSGGTDYFWTPATYLDNARGQNPLVRTPLQTIQYRLKVTDALGCSSLNTALVTVTVKQPPKIFAGNDTSVTKGEPLPLLAIDINNAGFRDFVWQPVTGLNNPLIQNPTAILNSGITYTVTGFTAEGCKASDAIKIIVYEKPDIFVPTGFTPNGDGLNDVLKAIPVGIKKFHYLKIFNRWGQLIFITKDHINGWNGTHKGYAQDPGSYTWVTEGIDFKGKVIQKKGVVLLLR